MIYKVKIEEHLMSKYMLDTEKSIHMEKCIALTTLVFKKMKKNEGTLYLS